MHPNQKFNQPEINFFGKSSGVYLILNSENLKVYIGSAVNLRQRLLVHRSELNSGRHDNVYLQRAFNENNAIFSFHLIENVFDKSKLIEREQFWIDLFESYRPELGYNLRRYAKSNLGIKMPKGFSEKISLIHKGRKLGPYSEERRKNISMACMGRIPHNKGKQMSADFCLKMTEQKLRFYARGGFPNRCKNPVIMSNQSGAEILGFRNIKDAARFLGGNTRSKQVMICRCCKGVGQKTVDSMRWKYA